MLLDLLFTIMVTNAVYSLLYRLVHWLIDVVCRVLQVVESVWKLWLSWTGPLAWTADNPCYVLYKRAKRLKRVPTHIGILFAEESISFVDISNLIMWCIAMGITFISLYDHDGVIKKKKHVLQEQLKETKNKLLGKHVSTLSSLFEVDFDSVPINGVNKNSSITPTKIKINIFSHIDGQHHIANVAANICQLVESGTIKASDIEVDSVSRYVNKGIMNCPDPDLVLQFGEVYSTLGFLPWNLRLTEILLLASHHNFGYDEFYRTLLRFSACEQRCGK